MRTFCWKCRSCGFRHETTYREAHDVELTTGVVIHLDAPDSNKMGSCVCSNPDIIRDYKAESVGVVWGALSDIRAERQDNRVVDPAELLPTAERDFACAEDPTGQKGLREWLDTHQPKNEQARKAQGQTERALGFQKQVY